MLEYILWYWAAMTAVMFVVLCVYDKYYGKTTGWQGKIVYAIMSACMGIVTTPLLLIMAVVTGGFYLHSRFANSK